MSINELKHSLARFIAWKLPPKVLFWAMIRSFADATTGKYSEKDPFIVVYKDVYDSLVEKYNIKD